MNVLAIVTALTALLLCGLGLARAGAAIRFVPYPVIGGFLGATGWLMVSGAVRVITDHPLGFATLETLIESHTLAKIAAGALWRSLSTSPCAVHGAPSCCRASCSGLP
jgi:SulP family sulfate permease